MCAVSVSPRGQNLACWLQAGMPSSPACLHRQQEALESQDWLFILEPHCQSVLVLFLQAENASEAPWSIDTACLCFCHFWQADCSHGFMILPCCFTVHLNSLCHLLVLGMVLLCSFLLLLFRFAFIPSKTTVFGLLSCCSACLTVSPEGPYPNLICWEGISSFPHSNVLVCFQVAHWPSGT